MISTQFILFVVTFKIIILFYIYNKFYIQKKLQLYFLITLFYDIATDIVNFMAQLPAGLRPWWFNVFMATGTFLFLGKVHSILKICCTFTKQENKFLIRTYNIISIFIGLLHFISNIVLFFTSGFSREFIAFSTRPLIEVYLSRFSTTLYPIILLAPCMYHLHKLLKANKIPRALNQELKNFFYFGLLPKTIADGLQTCTPEFIKMLLFNGSIANFSPVTTQIASMFSFLYIFFALRILHTISLYGTPQSNHTPEQKQSRFLLKPETFTTSKESNSLESVVLDSAKKTIETKLNISEEMIKIITFDEENRANFHSREENSLGYFIQNDRKLNTFLKQYQIVSQEHLDAYLYLFNDENAQEIAKILQEKEIFLIAPWMHTMRINGAIIIKNDSFFQPKKSTAQIIKTVVSCAHLLRTFYKQQSFDQSKQLDTFKEKSIQEQIKRLTVIQEEVAQTISSTMLETKIIHGFLQKNKIVLHDNHTINTSDDSLIASEQEEIERIFFDILEEAEKTQLPVMHKNISLHEKTHIFFGYPKNKNNKYPYGYALVFPKNLQHYYTEQNSRFPHIFLQFTKIGKKLNNLIPGDHPAIMRYKLDLISILLNPAPTLIALPSNHAPFLIKLLASLEDKKLELNFCSKEDNGLHFFDQHIGENQENTIAYIDTLDESHCLAFIGIEQLDKLAQARIAEYYISGITPHGKKVKKSPGKIIFTMNKSNNSTVIIDSIISQTSNFHELHVPLLYNFSRDNLYAMINSYTLSFNIDFTAAWKNIEKIIENTKNMWNIYDLMEYIELQGTFKNKTIIQNNDELSDQLSKEKETTIKYAMALGKNALKNKELMIQLATTCNNQTEIAHLLGVHRSSVSRFFKENQKPYAP